MGAAPQPPALAGLSAWGTLREFRRDPLALLGRVPRDQPFTRLRLGQQNVWLLTDPAMVQDVLVTRAAAFTKSRILQKAKSFLGEGLLTSEGSFHLQQRRLVQPAFHRERLAAYGQVMTALAIRHGDRWRDGQEVDADAEMMRLTLAIVGQTLFSADVEQDAREVGEAMTAMIGMFNVYMLPMAEWIERLPIPLGFRIRRARETMDRIIYRLIADRRLAAAGGQGAGQPPDLLSMLLEASDPEDEGRRMTDRQVRDEALTLFVAGHETTANALSWTWYLLSQHPEAEQALHAEVDSVLGGRPPALEDLPQLRVTEQIFAESMRLYPPAWAIGRMVRETFDIGGYRAAKGTVFLISPYLMHRDPRFFPDPERFDLARWTPEAREIRPRFAYFPFGGGVRVCIGERFAWMEGIMVLAAYAQRWRLRLAGPVPGTLPQITLRPRGGIRMRVENRLRIS